MDAFGAERREGTQRLIRGEAHSPLLRLAAALIYPYSAFMPRQPRAAPVNSEPPSPVQFEELQRNSSGLVLLSPHVCRRLAPSCR
jgi:hypothetical protein